MRFASSANLVCHMMICGSGSFLWTRPRLLDLLGKVVDCIYEFALSSVQDMCKLVFRLKFVFSLKHSLWYRALEGLWSI